MSVSCERVSACVGGIHPASQPASHSIHGVITNEEGGAPWRGVESEGTRKEIKESNIYQKHGGVKTKYARGRLRTESRG